MTMFFSAVWGLCLLWNLLIIFVLVFQTVWLVRLRRFRLRLGCTVLAIACAIAVTKIVLRYPQMSVLVAGLSFQTILSVLATFQQAHLLAWRRYHISPMSIKESLDRLPTGLCYYWPGGLVKLANIQMDTLCRSLTGDALTDAKAFWETLSNGKLPNMIQSGSNPIVCLSDGRAYSFRKNEITMEGRLLYELIAEDVSEEYRLGMELSEKQAKASYINARLKSLSASIKFMVMDKEALETKIRIHDQLGYALLHAKQFFLSPDSADWQQLKREWKRIVLPLLHDDRELWRNPYDSYLEQAEALGIELVIDGELPVEYREIIDTAVTVHLTNVLRHAKGTTAWIEARTTATGSRLRFTNNGMPPKGEIQETGGLGNLRRAVEQAGGNMEIISVPAFEIILTLPKETRENAL